MKEMNVKKYPERIKLANLPTQIEILDRLSNELKGPTIYVKRDDQTGTEVSGNKIRKLEFVLREALDHGCDTLITCGGIQSNHARATAAVAAKFGLKCYLVLKSDVEEEGIQGNYLLDKLLGASVKLISTDDYINRRTEIMESIKEDLEGEGLTPYIIPEGASNGIGTFGYFQAMKEILEQEEELGVPFDAIVLTVGSGGTYAGAFLANKLLGHGAEIIGFNVSADAEYFKGQISDILEESFQYTDEVIPFTKEEFRIVDGYVGRGYALSRPEELEFIKYLARLEGLILDPVYTGKAMYGLVNEIKKGTLGHYKNILFIHTGGLFGLFPSSSLLFPKEG